MAQLIRERAMSCEQCITDTRINRSFTRPPQQKPNEHNAAQGDAMQIDLVTELPPSRCFEKIVAAMDRFSR